MKIYYENMLFGICIGAVATLLLLMPWSCAKRDLQRSVPDEFRPGVTQVVAR